jgi:hypothetical protein
MRAHNDREGRWHAILYAIGGISFNSDLYYPARKDRSGNREAIPMTSIDANATIIYDDSDEMAKLCSGQMIGNLRLPRS